MNAHLFSYFEICARVFIYFLFIHFQAYINLDVVKNKKKYMCENIDERKTNEKAAMRIRRA